MVPLPPFPPGMIGVPCSRNGPDSDFLPAIIGLQKPAGTVFKKAVGLGTAAPLNEIARAFMVRPNLEWLFLTNDDNLCPPDTIPRLLRHSVPFVTGLYFSRIQPFEPVLFDRVELHSDLRDSMPEANRSQRWYYRKFCGTGDNGLQRIKACGDGCLMLHRKVLEAIPEPWWEYGETLSDACDHDMCFSRKVREAGFGMWVDMDLMVDHVTSMVVRPHRNPNGTWEVRLVQADRQISLPVPNPGWDQLKPQPEPRCICTDLRSDGHGMIMNRNPDCPIHGVNR